MQLHQAPAHTPAGRRARGSCAGWHARVHRVQATITPMAATTPAAQLEDKWLQKSLPQLHNQPADSRLDDVRSAAWGALATLRMPTTRNEEFRFTDLSPLTRTTLVPVEAAVELPSAAVSNLVPAEAANSCVVVVDGKVRPELGNTSGLPAGTYVGSVHSAPAEVLSKLNTLAASRGGPFSVLNAAAMQDSVVIHVPAGTSLEVPIYLLHMSTPATGAVTAASAPRLLLHAGEAASVSVVEEYVPTHTATQPQHQQQQQQQQEASTSGNGTGAAAQVPPYFACAVSELFLDEHAQVTHSYVVREAAGAVHVKATLVQQAESSSYQLTEARLGGGLTRHDVAVSQAGPATNTSMQHFVLAGAGQLHDLHTKLALDHPEGQANQLHKCIVTAPTGRGVFDGNVRVGRLAQKTDAGQLSRNLLLAPRATVNVKPNLQIIADDVKCTHGCAVSDLSDEELFYFRARGISALAARQALVASFGAEVTQRIKLPALQARIQADVRSCLQNVNLAALEAASA